MTRKTVSIRVDPDVWKESKILAVKSNLSIGELVEDALKNKLKRTKVK